MTWYYKLPSWLDFRLGASSKSFSSTAASSTGRENTQDVSRSALRVPYSNTSTPTHFQLIPVSNSPIHSSRLLIISSASSIVPLNLCCSSWKDEKYQWPSTLSPIIPNAVIQYFCVKPLTRLACTRSEYKTSFISWDWTLLVFLNKLFLSFSFAPKDLSCEFKQTQRGVRNKIICPTDTPSTVSSKNTETTSDKSNYSHTSF